MYVCGTHSVLRWSRWVFSRALLTQTGDSPGLLNLRVEHSEDQHHRQTLGERAVKRKTQSETETMISKQTSKFKVLICKIPADVL